MTTADDPGGFLFDAATRVPANKVDLRSACHRLGGLDGGALEPGTPRRRLRILPAGSVVPAVRAPRIWGGLDGIQRSQVLVRRAHRPLALGYAAAGCVPVGTRMVHWHHQRLFGLCSYLDEDEMRAAAPDLPIVALDERWPDGVAQAGMELLDRVRRHLERLAVAAISIPAGSVVAVDGDLRHVPAHVSQVVGVVKDTTNPYGDLDPTALAAGQCSDIFELQPERRTDRIRFSCYARLRASGGHEPEGLSIVRLETFSPETLEPLAKCLVNCTIAPGQPNARHGSHLRLIASTEDVLRAVAPAALWLKP